MSQNFPDWLIVLGVAAPCMLLVLYLTRQPGLYTCSEVRLIAICWSVPPAFGLLINAAAIDPIGLALWGAISLVGWADILRNLDCPAKGQAEPAHRDHYLGTVAHYLPSHHGDTTMRGYRRQPDHHVQPDRLNFVAPEQRQTVDMRHHIDVIHGTVVNHHHVEIEHVEHGQPHEQTVYVAPPQVTVQRPLWKDLVFGPEKREAPALPPPQQRREHARPHQSHRIAPPQEVPMPMHEESYRGELQPVPIATRGAPDPRAMALPAPSRAAPQPQPRTMALPVPSRAAPPSKTPALGYSPETPINAPSSLAAAIGGLFVKRR